MRAVNKFILVAGFIFLFFLIKEKIIVKNSYKETVYLGQKKLLVERAKTNEQRSQGLSDRDNLCSDCGMLFVFDKPDIYPFWMRRMHFDIDIVWLEGKRIVEIYQRAKAPESQDFDKPKEIYKNTLPADLVLEVNAGWIEKNGIKIGDELRFASN